MSGELGDAKGDVVGGNKDDAKGNAKGNAKSGGKPSTQRRIKNFGSRFSKFSVVGVANAAVDYGVLNLLIFLYQPDSNTDLVLYNLLALIAANINSYIGNAFWTFRERAEPSSRQRVLFALQALVNIGVSSGLFWLCIYLLSSYTSLPLFVGENIAKTVSIVTASVMSFFIMRHLVFSRKRLFGGRL
ncbi:MAG: GtrA family protein [Rubrobacter sp.]|nr:GtrA family protein [Rubrobacter sp.]